MSLLSKLISYHFHIFIESQSPQGVPSLEIILNSSLRDYHSRLSLLPFLSLAAAYPPAYIGYLKDFPEARNFADFTLFQTVTGMFQKVGRGSC